jgi:hypothetical protein
MKLKLEDLAPYLPYGLMCELTDKSKIKVAKLCGAYTDNSYAFFDTVESEHGYSKIKPILRPLSDLTKVLQWDDGQYMMTDFDDFDLAETSYNTVQDYLAKHFDVFGLIPKGLAIDINTLNK